MSAPNSMPTVSRGTDDENIRDRTEQPVRSAKSKGKLSSDRCTVRRGTRNTVWELIAMHL